MDLKALIAEAREVSPRFNEKYEWRVIRRGLKPDLEWLMPLLEDALSQEYVANAARLHIAKKDDKNHGQTPGEVESEGS